MPVLQADVVYNPTSLPKVLRFWGMSYVFEPFSSHEFHFSDDLATQLSALDAVRRKLGTQGLFVITAEELQQQQDPALSEEERYLATRQFVRRLKAEGQNRFLEHMRVQYIEHPAADNRRLAGVNKAPLLETQQQKRMVNLIRIWEKHLNNKGELSLHEQMLQDEATVNREPDIDLSKLNWKALRKVAADRGITVKRGMKEAELLELLMPGYKPDPAAQAADAEPEGPDLEGEAA